MTSVRMRVCVIGVLLAVIIVGERASAQAPARGSGQRQVPGPIRVIEADTLEVWVDGSRVGVKVIGIKAPPGNTACGREAIKVVSQLLADGIWLDEDLNLPSIEDRRKLRKYRVTTADGRSLAQELAREGFSNVEPEDDAAREFVDIQASENDAKGAQRGCVWSGSPIVPEP
jgi:endonuclease YncB( thermonuclease family)